MYKLLFRFRFILLVVVVVVIPTTTALAAAANKKTTKQNSPSNKGFGKAPPTLQETLATFRTRLPKNAKELPCPCGSSSGSTYATCCYPHHSSSSSSPSLETTTTTATTTTTINTPRQVLQARYTAFAWRMIPYIMDTTHITCREYSDNRIAWAKELNKDGMFDSFDFCGLEILKDDDDGNVEFKVTMRMKKGATSTTTTASIDEGTNISVIEKSKFIKDDFGKWLYASGEVRPVVKGLEDAILNP